MADQYVTCRHCGIGINYQCDCDDDAAEERGREEVWGKVLDVLRMVYGKDMPYNESPAELIADLVPPATPAPARDEVREAAGKAAEDLGNVIYNIETGEIREAMEQAREIRESLATIAEEKP